MYIASFGHDHLKEIRLKGKDVYIDVREDSPTIKTNKYGIDRKTQKTFFQMKEVKKYYKEEILKKVVKKMKSRNNHHWRVFIGDSKGRLEAVMYAEKLERDMIKKYKVIPILDHISITASI